MSSSRPCIYPPAAPRYRRGFRYDFNVPFDTVLISEAPRLSDPLYLRLAHFPPRYPFANGGVRLQAFAATAIAARCEHPVLNRWTGRRLAERIRNRRPRLKQRD